MSLRDLQGPDFRLPTAPSVLLVKGLDELFADPSLRDPIKDPRLKMFVRETGKLTVREVDPIVAAGRWEFPLASWTANTAYTIQFELEGGLQKDRAGDYADALLTAKGGTFGYRLEDWSDAASNVSGPGDNVPPQKLAELRKLIADGVQSGLPKGMKLSLPAQLDAQVDNEAARNLRNIPIYSAQRLHPPGATSIFLLDNLDRIKEACKTVVKAEDKKACQDVDLTVDSLASWIYAIIRNATISVESTNFDLRTAPGSAPITRDEPTNVLPAKLSPPTSQSPKRLSQTPPPANLAILTTALPEVTAGRRFFATLEAAGGVPPYRWKTLSGTLPKNIELKEDGAASGVPDTAGHGRLEVEVTDKASATAQGEVSWDVLPAPVTNTSYGSFAGLVRTAGTIMSAALAILFSWRRRAKWEPSDQDVDKGAERVAGLFTAIFMVLIWTRYVSLSHQQFLGNMSIGLGLAFGLSLLLYGYLVFNQTYFVLKDAEGNKISRRNIIGGFRLTEHAGKQLEQARQSGEAITTQRLLQKLSYDPDLVWPRGSRAIAKAVFVGCYILVNFFGSAALTCAAALAWVTSNT